MIEYRYERLDAARKNAFSHGYKGAMFPWESAGSGVEETPVWALSGPFEHHITACVGLAAWNYYCVTQDKIGCWKKAGPSFRRRPISGLRGWKETVPGIMISKM